MGTARRYRDREETLPELAEELGVDAVLHGSFQLAGDRIRISPSIFSVEDDVERLAEVLAQA